MAWKIVMSLDLPWWSHLNEETFKEIGGQFSKKQCQTEEDILSLARDADAIITVPSLQSYPRSVIQKLTRCRLLFGIGIGYEGIDVPAATDQGICVANIADYCLDEVSNHALALLLACSRKLFALDRLVRAGKWTVERPEIRYEVWPKLRRLREQTLGLIGFGRIPRTLVPKAKPLVARILVYDPYVSREVAAEFGVELVELDRLLRESDYISVHAALTGASRHMIGMEQLKKMKPTAYLINTARGEIIDHQALHTALTEGVIAGAALDVVHPEPPDPNDPLLKLDSVIVTGHSAHASVESAAEMRARPREEVIRVLSGGWPRNFVNPQVKDEFTAKWGPKA